MPDPVIDDAIPDLLTGPGVAHMLGVARPYIHRLREAGRLPCRVVATPPPPTGAVRTTRFIVFRRELIEEYQQGGVPAGPGHLVTDDQIPELVNLAKVAADLGVSTALVHQLFTRGLLKAKAAEGVPRPAGEQRRQATSVIVVRPQEVERVRREHAADVKRGRWAPAKP